MNLKSSTPELQAALAAAQAAVENASKNAANPHFKSRYADLAEVLNTVRPVFSAHGLAIIQSTEFDGAMVHVTTAICHALGGHITSRASCVPGKTDGQGVGAATTYLRRYSLAAMTGVAQEDDDGNAAAHAAKPRARDDAAEKAAADWCSAMGGSATPEELAKHRVAAIAAYGDAAKVPDSVKRALSARKAQLPPAKPA